jgi:hypothetical protein
MVRSTSLARGEGAGAAARQLKRGVFTSVPDLVNAIKLWAEHWNDDPKPFLWHKAAKEVIEKVWREGSARRFGEKVRRERAHQTKFVTRHQLC